MSKLLMITNVDSGKNTISLEDPVFKKMVTVQVSKEEVNTYQSLLSDGIEIESLPFVQYDSESGVIVHGL